MVQQCLSRPQTSQSPSRAIEKRLCRALVGANFDPIFSFGSLGCVHQADADREPARTSGVALLYPRLDLRSRVTRIRGRIGNMCEGNRPIPDKYSSTRFPVGGPFRCTRTSILTQKRILDSLQF